MEAISFIIIYGVGARRARYQVVNDQTREDGAFLVFTVFTKSCPYNSFTRSDIYVSALHSPLAREASSCTWDTWSTADTLRALYNDIITALERCKKYNAKLSARALLALVLSTLGSAVRSTADA